MTRIFYVRHAEPNYNNHDDVKAGRITEDEYKRILEKKVSFASGDMKVRKDYR